MKYLKKNSKILIFFAFIIITIVYHNFAYIGHYGYDDMHYSKLANDLTKGVINYNDHFSYRWTIIVATAISYKIFGINDFASAFPPMLLNIAIMSLIFIILYNEKTSTIIIGLSLYTLNNQTIFWEDKLMPDIYITFSVILTILSIYLYKFKNQNKKVIIYSLFFSLSIFFGFVSKGTIILILPLIFILALIDIITGKHIKFWIFSSIFTSFILLIYFMSFKIIYGDFFSRFTAIANNSYLNLCSYDKQPKIFLFRRLSYKLIFEFIKQNMFLGFIFTFAAFSSPKFKELINPNNKNSFFVFSSLILILSSNFMTISYKSYIPMCTDTRHYLFLIPIFAISSAPILTDFLENKKFKIQLIMLIIATAIISFVEKYSSFYNLYLPIFILFSIYIFLPKNKISNFIFLFFFVIILSINPFKMFLYAKNNVRYNEQKKIIIENVIKSNDNIKYVITDPVQKNLCEYYNSYKDNLIFLTYSEVDSIEYNSNNKILLINNWYTQYLSNLSDAQIPFFAKKIDTSSDTIIANKDLQLYIYKMEKLSQVDTIYKTFNNFETDTLSFWKFNTNELENTVVKNGKYSYKVKEYSSTFSANFSDIYKEKNNLILDIKLLCWQKDIGNAKLVIEIKDKTETYFWEGYEISKFIKSYGNWWTINIEQEIKEDEIRENSVINIYLWNIDKTEIYIDDFEINFLKIKD